MVSQPHGPATQGRGDVSARPHPAIVFAAPGCGSLATYRRSAYVAPTRVLRVSQRQRHQPRQIGTQSRGGEEWQEFGTAVLAGRDDCSWSQGRTL